MQIRGFSPGVSGQVFASGLFSSCFSSSLLFAFLEVNWPLLSTRSTTMHQHQKRIQRISSVSFFSSTSPCSSPCINEGRKCLRMFQPFFNHSSTILHRRYRDSSSPSPSFIGIWLEPFDKLTTWPILQFFKDCFLRRGSVGDFTVYLTLSQGLLRHSCRIL